MKKLKKKMRQALSLFLSLLLIMNNVTPALAYLAEKNGLKTVAGNDGQMISEEEDWITTFPTGMFALKDNTIHITENGAEKKITVYRLGGREGEATASIALIPAAAAVDEEGEYSNYANAAGAFDYKVRVEDPIKIIEETATDSDADDELDLATDSDADDELDLATDSVAKAKAGASPKQAVTYTAIEPNEDDPYGTVFIDLEFTDGEWVKDILISAPDDEEHEPEEFLLVMIYDATGAEFNDSANRATVCIADDEEALDSEMGFEVESVRMDRAEGTAVLTLVRTGGIQYVSSVDYYTEDGTALAGEDYVETSGNIGFINGFDTAEITVELIDDSIESANEEDDVVFYVHLENPKAGTIKDGADVLEVRLYNSNTAETRNLATMTHMPDVVDVSAELSVSDTPIADAAGNLKVNGEVVTEEKELTPARSVTAALGDAVNPRARTISYPGAIKFEPYAGTWKLYTMVSGENNNSNSQDDAHGYNSSSALLGAGKTGSSWYWRYGATVNTDEDKERTALSRSPLDQWYMETDNTIQARVEIDRLYEMYDLMKYEMEFESDTKDGKHNAVYAYIGKKPAGNAGEYDDSYGDNKSGAENYLEGQVGQHAVIFTRGGNRWSSNNKLSSLPKAFQLGSVCGEDQIKTVTDQINLKNAVNKNLLDYSVLNDYNYINFMVDTSADKNIHGGITAYEIILRRQAFNNDPVLTIHTADDQMLTDLQSNGSAAEQAAAKTLINEKLAPSVSISDGGTNQQGLLYIGSQLYVRENALSGTYRFHDKIRLVCNDTVINESAQVQEDAYGLYGGTIRLYNKDEDVLTSAEAALNLDVALDRQQKVIFSYGNSVDTNNDGIKTSEEQAAALSDIQSKFTNATMVLGTFNEAFNGDSITHKYYEDKEYKVSDYFALNENDERFAAQVLNNLKSINFNMDENDIVLFNGKQFAGNEDIPVTIAELELTTLEFQFYDNSCLDFIRDMNISSIASVGLYVDYNQNGKLDIRMNPETRIYETVEVNGKKDIYLQALVTDSYRASDLEPVVIDGVTYEQIVLVRYNMTPRSLRTPAGADGDETCLVIPNFTTIVTNEEQNARQSKEMQGYRAIDGKETMSQKVYGAEASVGFVGFPLGGDYSPAGYVDDGNGGYKVEWNPNWKGSLYKAFENPEVIKLDNSMAASDGYEAASSEEQINGYLGSIHGNDTYALTIHYNNEIQDTYLGTFHVQPEMGSFALDQNAMGELSVNNDGKNTGGASNLSDSDPKIKLPNLKLGVGPANLIMDDDMVGFSIGVPMYSKKTTTQYVEKGNYLPNSVETPKIDKISTTKTGNSITMSKEAINDYKNGTGLQNTEHLLEQMRNAAEKGADISGQEEGGSSGQTRAAAAQTRGTYGTNYVRPTGKTSQNGFNVALNMTFLWKYSNLTNKFEFNQAAILVAVGGSVKVTVYPEPIHIVYVFVAFGADVSVATGLEMEEYVNADGTRGTKVIFQGVSITPTVYIEAGAGVGVELANVELYLKFTISISASFATPEVAASFDKFVTTGAVGLRITLLFLNYQMDIVGYETGYDKNRGNGGWFFRWHALGDNFGGSTYSLRSREEIDEEYEANGIHILWPEDVEEEQNFYSAEENLPNPRLRAYQIPEVPFEVSGYNSAVSAYSLAENMDSGSTYELYTWEDSQGESHNYILYTIQKKKSDNHDNGMQNSTLVLSELVSASTETADGTVNALGMAHPFDRSNTSEPYVVVDAVMENDGSYSCDPTGDLDFSAYVDEDGKMSITWISYRADNILGDASASNAAAVMSRQTVVKNTVIDLAKADSERDRKVNIVSNWTEENRENAGYRFQPVSVDEKVSVFAEAVHYNEKELQELKSSYDEYFDTANDNDTDGATSGTGNPHAAENAQLNYDIDRVYGKYSALNIAVATSSNAESGAYTNYRVQFSNDMQNAWEKNQTRIDSIAMTQAKDGGYYLAYAVTGTVLNGEGADDMEKQMVKELFLQKLTIGADGTPVLGTPILLRVLVDNDKDSSKDGVYVNSELAESFENPYFTNLNFMRGALETDGDGKPVVENFFLFGMNGNTYVLNEVGLNALLEGEGSVFDAVIKPFFAVETFINEDGEEVQEADVRSDVVIGADGDGNIAAVYTDTVPNTVNNALYIVKYDPSIQGWGAPVMLAMNHMQVYEDSIEQNWSHEETREAYYTYDPYNGLYGGMDQFVFAAPSIALGSKSTDEKNGDLLVVTRGTLTQLTNATYTNIYGEPVTEIIPSMTNGYLDAKTGYYAIAYGIGNQAVSEAKLSFDYHNFTEGAILTPTISFRNTGDTAIRGSEANPITIQLHAAKVVTDEESGEKRTDGAVTTLMTWQVKEHILAGAEFDTTIGIGDELPPTADALPAGIEDMTLYFTISEDSDYVTSSGGTHFGWSSLEEGAEKDGISYYTVGSKAELSFGSLKVGAEGHTTIEPVGRSGNQSVETYVDMKIYNTGAEDAAGLKVKVEYSNSKDADGTQIWQPIDTAVTGNELNAGEPWKLEMPNVVQSRSRMPDGLLTLVKEDGTVLETLQAGYAVEASGILKLPVEYYDENDHTKSMNLRFTLVTESDEYTEDNNALYRSMEAVSLFDVPDRMNLTEGNTVEIPVNVRTTRQGLDPAVTVRELTGAGGEVEEPVLSSLYYNPDSQVLTMVPGNLGSGIVRIADINTGSFTDINFTVHKEGVNIVTTNPALTFHDSAAAEAAGKKSWEDQEYYAALTDALPYYSDTTIGKDGSSFTFTTFADNIDLYFEGTVAIAIKGNDFGYLETEYTSDNFFNPTLINFKNHKLTECEVTVTVKGEDTEFDKYVEFYGPRGTSSDMNLDDVLDQKKDTAAPIIIYGKSFPQDGKVAPDAELSFPVYFIDNSGIQSATIDGKAAELFAGGKAARKILTISGNTGYSLRVRDSAGNETAANFANTESIYWFGGTGTLTENSWPQFEAVVNTDNAEEPKLVISPVSGNQSGSPVTNIKVSRLELDDPQVITEISVADSTAGNGLTTAGGTLSLTENGMYLVVVTNGAGHSQTIPVWVTEVPEAEIRAVVKRIEDQLYYMVDCEDGKKANYAIYGSDDAVLDLSDDQTGSQNTGDHLLLKSEDAVESINGYLEIPTERYAYYILKAVPENGDEDDAVVSVYCELAKLTEVVFNQTDLMWRTEFTPDVMDYTIRVPHFDSNGNEYDMSIIEILTDKLQTATGSDDVQIQVTDVKDSVNKASAAIMVSEKGVTNTYTFHFVNESCTCKMTKVEILNDTTQYIGEDQEQLILELDIKTDRQDCDSEEHNQAELAYRFEILEGQDIANVNGTTLTVTDQGTVKIRVTAYNGQLKPVTSETITLTVTKKCLVTVESSNGGTVDVIKAHLIKGEQFTAKATPADGFIFLGWKIDGAEDYFATETELSVNVEKSIKIRAEFKDVELPTAEIQIESNAFRDFINSITFGLLFKERVEVVINASDNACVPEIEYYVQTLPAGTDKANALIMEELKAVTWTKNHRFYLDPDIAAVVYAQITDETGNCKIINSEGMNLDATAPTLEIMDRDQDRFVPHHVKVRIMDAGVGLQSVEYRLNTTDEWIALTLENGIGAICFVEAGSYQLEIRARDFAGNETIYTEAVVLTEYEADKPSSTGSSNDSWDKHDSTKQGLLYLPDGTVAKNRWILLNGIWYYAGSDGYALTGWFLDPANGYWYFLDEETGAMKTGWHWEKQDGYWYYLHPVNGEMLLGWQNINEKYYYLSPIATEPTWYQENGQWTYSGVKARPYGSMYENEMTPDGAWVGSDGARIGR